MGDNEGGLDLNVGERCRREFVLATVFIFALSGFFGIVGVGEDSDPLGGLYGGELRVALQDDIEENPLLSDDDASLLAVSLMYDSLAKIDEVTLLPEPWVAINWTLTSNTSVEVNFHTDVEWHDSTDASPHYITADDICYTYSQMKTSAHWDDLLQNVVCTEVDSDTVELDLSSAEQARGVFFSKVLTIPLIPDGFTTSSSESGSGPYKFGTRGSYNYEIIGDVVVDNAAAGQRYAIAGAHYHYIRDSTYDTVTLELFRNNASMPGTGYNVVWTNGTVSFTSALSENDQVTAVYDITSSYTKLTAFESHFMQRPYLDAVNYTFFPGDVTTSTDGAVKAMIDGMVDFIGFEIPSGSENGLRWEGGDDQTTLINKEYKERITVQTINPKLTLLYLGMNTPSSHNPLNDTMFRKGLSMSIKRELARSFEAGTTIADTLIHPSNTFWHNPTCPKFRVPKDENNQPIYTDIINHFQDSGYLDPDEDGYLEDPTGTDFKLELLVPPTTEDPAKASIGGQAIGEVFNDVGVETETIYLPSAQIDSDVDADNFWLYLDTLDVEVDPIFLYDRFHSSNAGVGETNLVNLNDPYLDTLLDEVRGRLDQNVRRESVMEAVCYLAETAPVGTILHYTVLETYEKVNYEGWVQMTGGVNNFWSYLKVHVLQLGPMKAQVIMLVDSILAGELLDVVVSATDTEDVPLSGAWVKVTNDYSDDVVIDYTDAGGQVAFNWTGPSVSKSTTVTFMATVRLPQYDEAMASEAITVHPELLGLDVVVGASENSIDSGDSVTITVAVNDDFGIGVPDATVLLTVSPDESGGTLESFSGTTDPGGLFQTTFTGDVSVSMQFNVKATASKAGYETTESQPKSILVEPKDTGAEQPIEMLIIIIVLVIVLVILIMWLMIRRMRAGRAEGPEEEEFEEEEFEEEEIEEEEEAEVLIE
jgi:ABC-type transport system substrate-binding protein